MNRKKKGKKKEFWVIYARCDATNFPRESNNIGIGIKIVRNPKTEQKKEKKLKKKGLWSNLELCNISKDQQQIFREFV